MSASFARAGGSASAVSISSAISKTEEEYNELGPLFTADYFSRGAMNERRRTIRASRIVDLGSDRTCQGYCYRISMTSWFQWFFGLLTLGAVSFNLWQIDFALETRMNGEVPDEHTSDTVSRAISVTMTMLFVIEAVVRLIGSPDRLWGDGWLVFDIIISFLAALDDLVLFSLSGKASSGLPAARAFKVFRVFRATRCVSLLRRWPIIQLVGKAMTEYFIRASWLIFIVSVISWCLGIVLTVVGGAEIVASSEDLEVTSAQGKISVQPLLGNMGGSLLLVSFIPLRVFRWGPIVLWPLLTAESVSLNVIGVVLLLYIVLFLSSMVHISAGVFMSAVTQWAANDVWQRNMEKLHVTGITCSALADMFEEAVGMDDRRSMSLSAFRQVMDDNLAVGDALVGGVEDEALRRKHIDALFRELDKSLTHSLDMTEFIVGIVKMTRVVPRLEFLQTDEQQTMTMRRASQTSDVYASTMMAMYRHVHEMKSDFRQLYSCMHSLRDNIGRVLSKSPSSFGFKVQRNNESLKTKLQNRCNFASRLDAAKSELSKARRPPRMNSEMKQAVASVMGSLLQEDFLPWLHENIQRKVLPRHADLQQATWQDVSMAQTAMEAVSHTQKQSTIPATAFAKAFRTKVVPCVPDPVFASSFVSAYEKPEPTASCQSAEEDEVIQVRI